jgi:hypothetical protein
MKKVIVTVENGIIEAINVPDGIEVEIRDFDSAPYYASEDSESVQYFDDKPAIVGIYTHEGVK